MNSCSDSRLWLQKKPGTRAHKMENPVHLNWLLIDSYTEAGWRSNLEDGTENTVWYRAGYFRKSMMGYYMITVRGLRERKEVLGPNNRILFL